MHVYYKGEMQYCTWVAIIISSDPLSAFEKAHSRVLQDRMIERTSDRSQVDNDDQPFPFPAARY